MNQYNLYRELARVIYALALEATEARDYERVAQVDDIARAAFKSLREELGDHTPIYGILEFLVDPKPSADDWSYSLEYLRKLKETYPEVLG